MARAQGKADRKLDVSQVCQLLRLGLAKNRFADVQQIVDDWCKQHYVESLSELKQRIETEPALLQSLIDSIMVAETFFFRHFGHFDFMRQNILPCLSSLNRPVRILSAGCATGEEAYSLAMLLATEMPSLKHQIYACDISEANISAAKQGVYRAWSLREPESWPQIRRYIDVIEHQKYQVKDVIKDAVTFFSCNLIEDFIQQPMLHDQSFDVIFCRNMMIYLTEPEAKKLSRRLISLLAPHGWLVPGPSDPINVYLMQLSAMESSSGLIFRQPLPATRQVPQVKLAVGATKLPSVLSDKKPVVQKPGCVEPRSIQHAADVKSTCHDGINSAVKRPSALEQQINELLQNGDTKAALARVEQQLRSAPLCTEAYLLQAMIYWQLDQYDCALASLGKVLYLAPDSPLPYYFRAKLLQKQGQMVQAQRQLLRAKQLLVHLNPKQQLPLMRLGTVAELTAAVTSELADVSQHTDLDRSVR
jgi:chemotaxis protein methyltransferase CheR